MEVVVKAQEGGRPEWTHRFAQTVSAAIVLRSLSARLGVDAEVCHLHSRDLQLTNQPLSQLKQNRDKTLELSASFDEPLSICIWQSLPVKVSTSTMKFWLRAAKGLADQQHWTLLQLCNAQSYDAMTAVLPSHKLPKGLKLCPMDMSSAEWRQVVTPVKPVLLLVHVFLLMSALQQAGIDQDHCISKVHEHMDAHVQQMSSCHDKTAPSDSRSAHPVHLRAAMLMLKLLQLLTVIRIPDHALTNAVCELTEAIFVTCQQAAEDLAGDSSQQPVKVYADERANLVLQTITLLFSASRQIMAANSDSSDKSVQWFCNVLELLLPVGLSGSPSPAFCEILDSGVVVFLVTVLEYAQSGTSGSERDKAEAAVSVLYNLLGNKQVPAELLDKLLETCVHQQAVPRLCKLLPPDLPNWLSNQADPAINKEQQQLWLHQHAEAQLPRTVKVVKLINKLLDHAPPPSDCSRLPSSPSPAVWQSLQQSFDLVLDVQAFYGTAEYHAAGNMVQCHVLLQQLLRELQEVPCRMMADHMPNLGLDATALMKSNLKSILLFDPAVRPPGAPQNQILKMFLKRLARDSSLLKLSPEEMREDKKTITRHRKTGNKCQGCPSCNGPDWHFKTASVAALWTTACYNCSKQEAHHMAAAAADAMYTALLQDEHCKHILIKTHQIVDEHKQDCSSHRPTVHEGIRNSGGHPTAQLTLAACLARLCTQEVKRAGKATAASTPWLTTALELKTFDVVYVSLGSAVNRPTPWSSERCEAVAKAMLRLGQLHAAQPSDPAFQKFQGQQHAQLVSSLLPQISSIHENIVMQELVRQTCLHLLDPSMMDYPVSDDPIRKELCMQLIDLLVDPAYSPYTNTVPSDYTSFGSMPHQASDRTHSRVLAMVIICIPRDPDVCKRFWQLAMPLLPSWFELSLKHEPDMSHFQADLFGAILERYSSWHPKDIPAVPPPLVAVGTLIKAIFSSAVKVIELEQQVVRMRSARLHKQATRQPSVTADLPAAADSTAVEESAAKFRHGLDGFLGAYAAMQKDEMWKPVLAVMPEEWNNPLAMLASKCDSSSLPYNSQSRQIRLPASTLSKLQNCLLPAETGKSGRLEAAAQSAAAELLQEEDTAAARAAAKKAKRQRQKAKKQQTQQSEPKKAEDSAPTSTAVNINGEEEGFFSSSSLPKAEALAAAGDNEPQGTCTPEQGPGPRPNHAPAADKFQEPDEGAAENSNQFLQHLFCCPITKMAMKEPVIAADGHTYEKAALENWLQSTHVSPVTGTPLAHTRIVTNILIRNVIANNI